MPNGTELLKFTPRVTEENPDYLSSQLVTYIGNKRALLPFIDKGIMEIQNRLNKKKLTSFDVFSGSGVVARYLKQYSSKIVVNDLERYSQTINNCYLSNRSELDMNRLNSYYREIANSLKNGLTGGFITENYAPSDESNITRSDRVFYTRRNAMYLDTARQMIEKLPDDSRDLFIAPLLSEASIHANTSGVFKGFYKDRNTKVGKFGGTNGDALSRITSDISLPFPILSNYNCEYEVHRGDSLLISKCIDEVDLAYIDPPYNQHPYGSNYFMLNLITDYIEPSSVSRVSGIPKDWNRSLFNKKKQAFSAMENLVNNIKAKYLLISFNSEGYISQHDMLKLLARVGKTTFLETQYNTFRGSRNLKARPIHVKEYLYLVEKH